MIKFALWKSQPAAWVEDGQEPRKWVQGRRQLWKQEPKAGQNEGRRRGNGKEMKQTFFFFFYRIQKLVSGQRTWVKVVYIRWLRYSVTLQAGDKGL